MSDIGSQQEQGLDLWVTYQHHKLVVDVVGILEVEAGLREMLIPLTHHANLVTDLARCLDVEAGLASIVPVAGATSPDHVNVARAEPDSCLLKFLHAAASWCPSTRLAMRNHPIFTIAAFHDRAQTLVLSLGTARDLASGLDHKLECILHRVRDRVPDLPPDLVRALDRGLDHALSPARDLGSYLDRTLDRTRDLARDLARDLGSELTRTRDLDRLPTLDLNYTLDRVLNLDYALDRHLAETSNYALLRTHNLAHHHVRVRALIRDLDRVHSFASELTQTIQAIAHFHQVLSDVCGVDLQSIDLTAIALQGLRWSARTQWPPEMENQIWRDSVRIADGIFEVDTSGTTDATADAAL